ncbi:MAG TPA: prohibitin family protein [Myxococcota bacterium]|nr:prohibitin family protein [Myxococcota bacterium]
MGSSRSTALVSLLVLSFLLGSLPGCTIVRPGEVGLRQRLGRLEPERLDSGPHAFMPGVTRIVKTNVRTVEIYETLPLPTREGLSVEAQITLLYHVDPAAVRSVYTQFGPSYETVFVLSNFLATAREVSSKYYAKELYAIERKKVEQVMKDELVAHVADKGFVIDAVLLKDILLPQSMSNAIQDKVNAEQAALQMEFVIAKQQREAERMRIEAEGVKQAQEIINSSLTESQLRYNQIQMLKALASSPNTKVIVTGDGTGKMPLIVND